MKSLFAIPALAATALSLAACSDGETEVDTTPDDGEIVTEDIMAEDPLGPDEMEAQDEMSAETMMGQEPAEDMDGALDEIDGTEPLGSPVEEPQMGGE